MFRSINDIPSHVFFVHVPVVAIPVMSLLAVIMGVRKRPPVWLRNIVLGGTILTVVATWFAVQSGQEFDEIIGDRVNTDRHQALANRTMLFALGLMVAVIGLYFVISRLAAAEASNTSSGMSQARIVLALATIVFAALSTVWVVRTGEEGARITWDGVIPAEDEG
jgi:uncharacterized membrane protein